tara:strand:+ start:3429 stop:4961 length:1533 start_codon:yes stop_codon:yes gene_type:complete
MNDNYWEGAPFPPREWQRRALPIVIKSLKSGERNIVSAIMGAGKSVLISEIVFTALKNLRKDMKILICAPRKNLINQLSATIGKRCGEENIGKFFSDEKIIDRPIIVTTFVSSIKLADQLKEHGYKVAVLIGDEVHGTESSVFKFAFEDLNPACAIGFTATPFRANEKESLSLWGEAVYRYTAREALEDGVIVPWELMHWNGEGSSGIDTVCLNMIKKMKGQGIVSAANIEDAESYAAFLTNNGIRTGVVHSQMNKEYRNAMIRCLENKEIQVIVHVSMLSEGVDMPYLNWLVLRRRVGSKVRFVQEVGRVLRAFPGKKKAVIGDPHNLFGAFSLHNPEQLGDPMTKEEQKYEELLIKLEDDPDLRDIIRKMPTAVAFSKIDSYIISLLSILRSSGICAPPSEWEESQWRGMSATPKQLKTLGNVKWSSRYLPKEIRETFKLLIDEGITNQSYLRGTASDLISILSGLAKGSAEARKNPNPYKRHWKMPAIDYPTPDFPIKQLLFVMERN